MFSGEYKGNKIMKILVSVSALLLSVLLFSVPVTADSNFQDLFGGESYFHPFISIDQSWSDNIYKIKDDKTSDYWVKTSPGIWLALPGSAVYKPSVEELGRFQAFLSYNPDFINYASENDHDEVDHNLDGYLYFASPGGFSIEISDEYRHLHDDIIEDHSNIRYADNTLSTDLRYEATEKIALGLNHTYFIENYESIKNSQDRSENGGTVAVYYNIFSKTDVFFELGMNDIKYDNLPVQDSTETEYLVGIKWDITDKSRGTFKIGYLDKEFDTDAISDTSTLKMLLNAGYEITYISDISVTVKRETTETDELNATYIESTSLFSTFRHIFTDKITGFFSLYYNIEDYDIEREDTTMSLAPSLKYKFNEIFSCDLAFTYEDVESDGDASDDTYTANTLLLSVSASL